MCWTVVPVGFGTQYYYVNGFGQRILVLGRAAALNECHRLNKQYGNSLRTDNNEDAKTL